MREIKFRAKANIDNEWIYASNIHKVVLDDTNEELWVMHPKGEKIEHLGDGYIKYRPLVVDEETIGQYTGLKDKNGVEIYEGDIVEYEDFSGGLYLFKEQPKAIGIIKIDNLLTGIYLKGMGTFKGSKVEIIGNIYEHPELIKEREHE